MLDFLFYLCIEPLESAMRAVLLAAHSVTGSWGASLVLLSLAVNTALIPIYHLAETWQEAERAVQRKMAPKMAEIKAVFTGRERYMYTRALYRLYGYSPIYALRTSFGLLIQIPFFFAAYHLLNAAPELAGEPWLFLADLAKPDSLLSFGKATVNLLPFAMTAVNLLSAAVYTSRLTTREKIQLYGLAAVFLVLLYPSSSALLVYWTCNNLFSLGKNLVYTRFLYASMGHPAATADYGLDPAAPRPSAWTDVFPAAAGAVLFAAGIVLRKRMGVSLAVICVMALAAVLAALAVTLRLRALKKGVDRDNSISRVFGILPLVIAFVTALCVWKLTSFKKVAEPQAWVFFRIYAVAIGLLAGWAFAQRPLQPLLCRIAAAVNDRVTVKAAGKLFTASILVLACSSAGIRLPRCMRPIPTFSTSRSPSFSAG